MSARMVAGIPQQILQGQNDHENQELVLYSLPKSLTVAEERDSVRKAIIEARQRAREKAANEARHQDMNFKYDQNGHENGIAETAHGYNAGYAVEDPDAMDTSSTTTPPAGFQLLSAGSGGSLALLTTLSASAYRTLSALQSYLTTTLLHPLGLNPKGYRAVDADLSVGNIVGGG